MDSSIDPCKDGLDIARTLAGGIAMAYDMFRKEPMHTWVTATAEWQNLSLSYNATEHGNMVYSIEDRRFRLIDYEFSDDVSRVAIVWCDIVREWILIQSTRDEMVHRSVKQKWCCESFYGPMNQRLLNHVFPDTMEDRLLATKREKLRQGVKTSGTKPWNPTWMVGIWLSTHSDWDDDFTMSQGISSYTDRWYRAETCSCCQGVGMYEYSRAVYCPKSYGQSSVMVNPIKDPSKLNGDLKGGFWKWISVVSVLPLKQPYSFACSHLATLYS